MLLIFRHPDVGGAIPQPLTEELLGRFSLDDVVLSRVLDELDFPTLHLIWGIFLHFILELFLYKFYLVFISINALVLFPNFMKRTNPVKMLIIFI